MKDLRFNEERITQAAAHLLKRRGGSMSFMKLVKLLYLADREALLTRGRPISFDQFVAMPHGPVPSRTLDLARKTNRFGSRIWGRYISKPNAEDDVSLHDDPGVGKLSENQVKILDHVFQEWGDWGRFDLNDYTHTLPEYVANQPDATIKNRPIEIRDILSAEGVSPAEIEQIEEALQAESAMQELTR